MLSFKQFNEETYLIEGGAFGHLSNVFDIDFSKKKLVDIIHKSLELDFDTPEIKTDAINLMVSYKNGKVIAARNKSHLKNFGENALDIKGIADKFKGREVGVAYTNAMTDIESSIKNLSEKQLQKIFKNGAKWMSIEVIGHGGANIIDYQGIEEIRLHGTLEHNEEGEVISQINKEDSRVFEGMLKQRQADRQKSFSIKKLTKAQFNPIQNLESKRDSLVKELHKIMGSAKSINHYKETHLRSMVSSKLKDKGLEDIMIKRWIHGDKTKLLSIYKKYADKKKVVQQLDKNIGPMIKKIMLPLEKLFLKLGSIVVGALNVFMTLDPKETKKDLQKQLKSAIAMVNSKGDEKIRAKLKMELERLNAAGGVKNIHPEEGITFFVDDHFVKLTGSFAATNAIINLIYRLPGNAYH